MTNELGMDLVWTGNRFWVKKTQSFRDAATDLDITGTFDSNTSVLLTLEARKVETVPNSSMRETVFTLKNTPLSTYDTRYAWWGERGAALRPLVTVKDINSTMYGGKWTALSEYTSTNWGTGSQALYVMVDKDNIRLGIKVR